MATVLSRGFTVIELMLFLGVTGALFAALMVGIGGAVTQQRYRESVVSYATFLQNQYTEASNTRNDRATDSTCSVGSDGRPLIDPQSSTSQLKGTAAPCVLLGRAIQVVRNGSSFVTAPVVGVEPQRQQVITTDSDTLRSYRPHVASFDRTELTTGWGTKIRKDADAVSNMTLFILRSPSSGLVRAYVSDDEPLTSDDISERMTPASATTPLELCITGDSGSSPQQHIVIDPRISGPDGISVREDGDRCA